MCIIAIKEKGKDLPNEDILRQMFEYNNDGAGYAYNKNGEVIIRKGFMTFDAFNQSVNTVQNIKDCAMLLHFRITTSGGVSPANTHPFPISDKLSVISKIRTKTDVAMVHNGIISSVGGWSKKYSDTMEFVMEQVSIIKEMNPLFYKDKLSLKLLERLADSKLAFIDGEGHLSYVGSFTEDDGILYSNSSYKGYRTTGRGGWYGGDDYNYTAVYGSEKRRYVKFFDSSHYLIDANGEAINNLYFEYVMDAYGIIYKLDYTQGDHGLEHIKEAKGVEAYSRLVNGEFLDVNWADISTVGEWLDLSKTQSEIDTAEMARLLLIANNKAS